MKHILVALVLTSITIGHATDLSQNKHWMPKFDRSPNEYIPKPQISENTPKISILATKIILNRLNLGIYNSIGLTQETLPVAIVLVENSDKIGTALVTIGTTLGNPTLMAVGGAALAVAGKKEPVLKVLRSLQKRIKL